MASFDKLPETSIKRTLRKRTPSWRVLHRLETGAPQGLMG